MVVQREDSGEVDMYVNEQEVDVEEGGATFEDERGRKVGSMKEVEEGKRKEVERVRDRRKRQGMRGAQSREKNLKDGGCTSIYCTHSMTDLHAIVVNSFVS